MKNSFKELKVDELVAKRAELRKKYFDFRFQAIVGHVENPVQARNPTAADSARGDAHR